ncbi:MAG: Ldh family oxidoreductase [Hoeflea sp.]|uniref:Ldh family oxidoreductase n=1 Tax=Hoeflea sp. TaxID=1940281 RepID=UPI003EF5EEA8
MCGTVSPVSVNVRVTSRAPYIQRITRRPAPVFLIAIALPSWKYPPVVLDMATRVAAYGKGKVTAQRGEMIPEGWMVDKNGAPLTDPTRVSEGFLLPIGGAKGYGLALVIGILAGTLNGAYGRSIVDFNADTTTVTNTGHMNIALDIKAFTDPETFKAEVDTIWEQMKSSPRMPGVDEIRLPGKRLHSVTGERTASGIPLSEPLRAQLAGLADELGVTPFERLIPVSISMPLNKPGGVPHAARPYRG